MCLGIPMRIVAVEGDTARCEAGGIERNVSLFMLSHQPPQRGDYVLVHVGYAIQKIDAPAARDARRLHREMLDAERNEDGGYA